ncbi:hypothetical protein QA264_06305 [Glaesserella parasuis]|uniref:hypothetical protein n=1 Tax=Glaesserella parasuis TaxID=738 RepID=UPI000ACCB861|nr:hypothetical protein [Glaesserella parasuis]MDD2170384.1 hypothetical protein [Glaesserella parasuis]MDG6280393.1 hypothetical protein [Glaesserella parasuis]MDG6307851.1 hypothetical protein [Glaesserella parasuis]MDG6316438.1 hypothetical protein [Glaesserella parasuis]MDG6337431.1 hypothetical protein [Glaesserella parasuis]
MKAIKRTAEVQNFINAATSGEIAKKPKSTKASQLSNVVFTESQWNFINKVLEISKVGNVTALFNIAADFMKKDFNYLDYSSYTAFLIGNNAEASKRFSIRKDNAYTFFKGLYEEYKENWINIRLRGVLLLALLNYAKKGLNCQLDDLL